MVVVVFGFFKILFLIRNLKLKVPAAKPVYWMTCGLRQQ